MDTKDLNLCIAVLRELREHKHKELGASLVVELDAVILQLEHCRKGSGNDANVGRADKAKALEVIGLVLKATTNLAELIKAFFGPQ